MPPDFEESTLAGDDDVDQDLDGGDPAANADELIELADLWDKIDQRVDERVREHLDANRTTVRRAQYERARSGDPVLGDVEIRRELAARCMARNWTQRTICAVLSLSPATMCRWAKTEQFQARVQAVKAERAAARASLIHITQNEAAEPVTRLRAADSLARLTRSVLPEPHTVKSGGPQAADYLAKL